MTPSNPPPVVPPVAEAASPPPPLLAVRGPTQARPPRRMGWMITSLVLFVLLGLSLLLHFGGFVSLFMPTSGALVHQAGPRMQEAVLDSTFTRNKIAVITLNGIIMGDTIDGVFGMVDVVQAQLKRAAEDEQVKAVVLKVDSPGGEVLAADEIYQAVLKFQKDTHKPVVASMGSVAASGGYYVSAPCQWIVANEMTITGSIGVIMSGFNYRGLMDKVGLRPEVFKSGPYKDMLRGSKQESEITPKEREMVQNLIDETYARFKSAVQNGRAFAADKNRNSSEKGRPLVSDWVEFADGRIFSGKEAERLGFVDETGNFRTAVARAKKLSGIREASLVEYRPIFDLSTFLRLFGQTGARSVKVDVGVNLPKLKTGHLYFLSPTYLY